jgi:hypothetical protein
MLFRETVTGYCENHMEYTCTSVSGMQFLYVKVGGILEPLGLKGLLY